MQLEAREGYLRAFVSGNDSLDVSLSMWRMARVECERLQARRLMLVEALTGNVPVDEAALVVDEIVRLGFTDTRIAFVDSHGEPRNDEHAETLALENGLVVRVFTDEATARLWLLYGEA